MAQFPLTPASVSMLRAAGVINTRVSGFDRKSQVNAPTAPLGEPG